MNAPLLNAIKNLPVGRKLIVIALLTSGVALFLAFVGFMTYEISAFRRSMVDDHKSIARMLGENSASAITFQDPESAANTLRTVAAHAHVVVAGLYDSQGQFFAAYENSPSGIATLPPVQPNGHRWSTNSFEIFMPVEVAGELAGTVYVHSSLASMRKRIQTTALITLAVLGVSAFAAFFVARRLQHLITGPVSHLAQVARVVAADRNYSVRATKHSEDELGALVDTFNAMLEQIQRGDRALREAHDHLEGRVAERTRELQLENAERRRSEQALSESHQRFEIVTRATSDAVWDWNVVSGTLWWNDNFQSLFGYDSADVPHSLARWQACIHADDVEAITQGVMQAMEGSGALWSGEYRFRRADGSYAFVHDRGYILRDDTGRAVRMIGALQDISERKRAQEQALAEQARFKFIFDAVPVGISLVSPDESQTVLVNPAHERITGVSAADSLKHEIFQAMSHPDEMQYVRRYSAGEIDHFTLEKRYLHPSNRIVWVALTSRMFVDPATGAKQSVTTLVDITERKEAEARLAETHKQLLDSSRQAGMAEVATGVLHNVGNVLNSVNVSTTLLSDIVQQSKIDRVAKLRDLLVAQKDLAAFFSTDPRGLHVPGYLGTLSSQLAQERGELLSELESLRKNVEHIKEIVAMQQSYAKVSGISETVAVTDLVEDALRMSEGALERHAVQLVRDFQAAPIVTVEKHKVLQILVNLIRNAKYACDDAQRPDKQLILRVTASHGRVQVAVIDNGVGIAAENLTRIFAHGFTTRKHGHGFGLHSGALAARELGGALTAHSEGPGRGAMFVLELPDCSPGG